MTMPNMNGKCACEYGNFTMSTYIEGAHECLTATDTGNVVMWSHTFVSQPYSAAIVDDDKMFLKAIRVQKQHITSITSVDGYVCNPISLIIN